MITIKRFSCNMLTENCYVVSDETKQSVIIDCGAFYPEEGEAIVKYIRDNDLTPKHLLCTHGHFDHCFGNGLIYKTFGLKPEVHHEDKFLLETMQEQIAKFLGVNIPIYIPPIGKYLTELDTISFGSHTLSILNTPGHTPGGVIFYCAAEKIAFSGDTLFRMSIGRTDFERGSYEQMISSLERISKLLPTDTIVYPGHGPETSIGDERRYNPYMKG